MAEEQQQTNLDTPLGFSAQWFQDTTANEGGGFVRHPHGDYHVEIVAAEIKPSGGSKPHNMIFVTTKTLAVAGDGDPDAVGMTHVSRYGTPGDPEAGGSPPFMQQRTRCLLNAVGIGQDFTPRQLLGRQFEATFTWKAPRTVEDAMGAQKTYIDVAMEYERPVGAKRPLRAPNTRVASAVAIKYLDEQAAGGGQHESSASSAGAVTPAWEQTAAPVIAQPVRAAAVAVAPTATASAAAASPANGGNGGNGNGGGKFMAEEAIPQATRASVFTYRAHIAMGTPQAAQARTMLVNKGINPDGPINPDLLQEAMRVTYQDWVAKQPAAQTELPGLDDVPTTPTAAPAAASKPKTGTRTARPAASA